MRVRQAGSGGRAVYFTKTKRRPTKKRLVDRSMAQESCTTCPVVVRSRSNTGCVEDDRSSDSAEGKRLSFKKGSRVLARVVEAQIEIGP